MKKVLAKIFRRSSDDKPSRITNDTVAEHRERVLAGGRRFKYPIQYVKHKLIINTIVISVVSIAGLVFIGWWQLYSVQNTSDFMYRTTRVLPLAVASVDGYPVPYSDYLMKYRSAVHYLETKEQINLNSDDGRLQAKFIKEQSIDDAVADAYAAKLAKDLKITVSDAELEAFLKFQRQSSDGEVSEQTYNSVILDYYNWTPDEYRYATKSKLLRQKVSYAVDIDANTLLDSIKPKIKDGIDVKALSESIKPVGGSKISYGVSGWVPRVNQDGGLSTAAVKLKKGGLSGVVESTSGDGYYFVKLVDINSTQVRYEYIRIPLSVFNNKLQKLIDEDKVNMYIEVDRQESER